MERIHFGGREGNASVRKSYVFSPKPSKPMLESARAKPAKTSSAKTSSSFMTCGWRHFATSGVEASGL